MFAGTARDARIVDIEITIALVTVTKLWIPHLNLCTRIGGFAPAILLIISSRHIFIVPKLD